MLQNKSQKRAAAAALTHLPRPLFHLLLLAAVLAGYCVSSASAKIISEASPDEICANTALDKCSYVCSCLLCSKVVPPLPPISQNTSSDDSDESDEYAAYYAGSSNTVTPSQCQIVPYKCISDDTRKAEKECPMEGGDYTWTRSSDRVTCQTGSIAYVLCFMGLLVFFLFIFGYVTAQSENEKAVERELRRNRREKNARSEYNRLPAVVATFPTAAVITPPREDDGDYEGDSSGGENKV